MTQSPLFERFPRSSQRRPEEFLRPVQARDFQVFFLLIHKRHQTGNDHVKLILSTEEEASFNLGESLVVTHRSLVLRSVLTSKQKSDSHLTRPRWFQSRKNTLPVRTLLLPLSQKVRTRFPVRHRCHRLHLPEIKSAQNNKNGRYFTLA